jgi:hypothetical protein
LPGVALGYLPQLITQHILFGAWLPTRPPYAQGYPIWPGHYLDVLVSSHNGVLLWAPVFLIALVGIALLNDRRLQVAGLLGFAIELAMMGSQADWWGGFAFGPRRFLVLLPIFVVGLAEVIQRLPRPAVITGCVALVAWNLVLVANFVYIIRADKDIGYAGVLSGQLQALPYVAHLFAQGGVVRGLLLWPLLGTSPDPLFGITLLAAEAAALVGAAWLALRLIRGRSQEALAKPSLGPPVPLG